MESPKITIYNNGVIIKPLPNRSVAVIKKKSDGTPILAFRRADCDKEELKINPACYRVIKGKISELSFNLSDEAGYALFVALGLYYDKISPDNLSNECKDLLKSNQKK